MTEAFMKVGEVCKLFNVHGNTLRRWCDQGLIKFYRLGPRRDRRFRREDVAEFLTRNLQTSPRKSEVEPLVARGLSNAEIAEQLNYTEGTVRWHLHSLYKLHKVHTREELIEALKLQEVARSN